MTPFRIAVATALAAAPLAGQTPPGPAPEPLALGSLAPDFAIPGATRHGVLRDLVRVSDFRGKTVVLAFFFKARTRG